MPIADTRSGPIYYDEYGDGRSLLIAHGGPGLSHDLYRSLDRLGSTRRLVYWDHRGHGRSGPLPESDVTMSLFADDTVALADHLGIETFALFGHSFGGWVAQEAALRHPDRVSALILAATTPGQLGQSESLTDDQGPPMPDEVAALMSRQPQSDAEVVEIYTHLAPFFMRDSDPSILINALEGSLTSADSFAQVFAALGTWSSVDRLHQITCPTLILAGRHDVFCSPQQLERIAKRIPHAQHITFETGHFMWLEQPQAFYDQVIPWVTDHQQTHDLAIRSPGQARGARQPLQLRRADNP